MKKNNDENDVIKIDDCDTEIVNDYPLYHPLPIGQNNYIYYELADNYSKEYGNERQTKKIIITSLLSLIFPLSLLLVPILRIRKPASTWVITIIGGFWLVILSLLIVSSITGKSVISIDNIKTAFNINISEEEEKEDINKEQEIISNEEVSVDNTIKVLEIQESEEDFKSACIDITDIDYNNLIISEIEEGIRVKAMLQVTSTLHNSTGTNYYIVCPINTLDKYYLYISKKHNKIRLKTNDKIEVYGEIKGLQPVKYSTQDEIEYVPIIKESYIERK